MKMHNNQFVFCLLLGLFISIPVVADEEFVDISPWPRAPSLEPMPTELLFEWSSPSFHYDEKEDVDLVDVSGVSTRVGLYASISIFCDQRDVRFLMRDDVLITTSNEIYRIHFETADGKKGAFLFRVAEPPQIHAGMWLFSGADHTLRGSIDKRIKNVELWVEEEFPSSVGSVFIQDETAMPLSGAIYEMTIDKGRIVGILRRWTTGGSALEALFSSSGEWILSRNSPNLGENFWVAELGVHQGQRHGLRWVWDGQGVPLNVTPWQEGVMQGLGMTFSNGIPSSVRYIRDNVLLYEGRIDGHQIFNAEVGAEVNPSKGR